MPKFALGMFSLLIALVAGLVALTIFAGANLLSTPAGVTDAIAADLDSIVVTEYGVMRVTNEGLERVPDSVAALYLPAPDSLLKNLSRRENLSGADAIAVVSGEALFLGNCAQCHAINEVVIGPALKDIHERRPIAWLVPWIQNSSKMVAAGDEYAVKIYNQYQKQEMPSFALSDTEIQQLVKYIEIESAKGIVSVW